VVHARGRRGFRAPIASASARERCHASARARNGDAHAAGFDHCQAWARPDGVGLAPSTDSFDPSRVIQMTLVDLVTARPSPSAP
jgi:hypothetical protein